MGLFSWTKSKDKKRNKEDRDAALDDGNLNVPDLEKRIFIKQIKIKSNRDFMLLRHELLNGNIMIVNLNNLVNLANGPTKDRRPLQKQLNLIKKYCLQHGGSISKLNRGKIIVAPNDKFGF